MDLPKLKPMKKKGQISMENWQMWLVPLVMLLLVFTVFRDTLQPWLDGIASVPGQENGLKLMVLSFVFFMAIILGVGIAISLHGEDVNMKTLGTRLGLIVVLFALAWVANSTMAIYSV